jgi:prepilin-type N-terminal cleavage/methylation domain-containing protein
MRRDTHTRSGFTMIELMIVVSIIGVLAAIAIPAFQNYQNRSKRSEAFANLAAMAKLEKSRFTEYGAYVDSGGSWPATGLSSNKRQWTPVSEAQYAGIGFRPDGAIYYDYEARVDTAACPQLDCFTATAYGDAYANGFVAIVQYVEPNATGAFSAPLIPPPVPVPIDPTSGAQVFSQVAFNASGDPY